MPPPFAVPIELVESEREQQAALYLKPPKRAALLCVNEKSQRQAVDRTAPILTGASERVPATKALRHFNPVPRRTSPPTR